MGVIQLPGVNCMSRLPSALMAPCALCRPAARTKVRPLLVNWAAWLSQSSARISDNACWLSTRTDWRLVSRPPCSDRGRRFVAIRRRCHKQAGCGPLMSGVYWAVSLPRWLLMSPVLSSCQV